MSRRVLCKFFIRGECLNGEYCSYSHQLRAPPNNICSFYHKVMCAYGDQCKDAHTDGVLKVQSPDFPASGVGVNSSVTTKVLGIGGFEVEENGFENMPHGDFVDDGVSISDSAKQTLSTVYANGECHLGAESPRPHEDCSEAQQLSLQIECSVCLERVLSKTAAKERKFGMLLGCDHVFCIMCIRSWRKCFRRSEGASSSPKRSCPICRRFSSFVIPSKIWYTTREEKQEIIDNYKAKLRSVNCKHFDFGNGKCPFRTDCLYKHIVRPGSLLWNAAMGEDVNNLRVQELTSSNFEVQDFFAPSNNPNPQDLENGPLSLTIFILNGPELRIKDVRKLDTEVEVPKSMKWAREAEGGPCFSSPSCVIGC